MSATPSVSAIIAVYNPNPDFLKRAVSSILEQSYPVTELLIVNDGGDPSVLGEVLPQDSRIRVFSKNNEGVAATRNYAIQRCTGDYVAFLDQDDYWYPEKIREQLSLVPETGMPCMVVSPVVIVDDMGNVVHRKSAKASAIYDLKSRSGDALRSLVSENFIYSSTPFIHRRIFSEIGGFDPGVQPHDDWDMFLRIAIAGFPIYFTGKPLSVWRVHESNESKKDALMQRSMCRVYEKLMPTIKDPLCRKLFLVGSIVAMMERDNSLLFKNGRYSLYRRYFRGHLCLFVKNSLFSRGKLTGLIIWEIRYSNRTVLKSLRRYLVSLVAR